MISLILIASVVYARTLVNEAPLTSGLTLSINDDVDVGKLQFIATRDLSNDDGWFAVGFPDQENPSMIGTRAYICAEIDGVSSVRNYEIGERNSMDPNWLLAEPESACSFSDGMATMTFVVDSFDITAYQIAYAINRNDQRNPEAVFSTCRHGSDNRGFLTLNAPREYVFRNVYTEGNWQTVKIASAHDDNEFTSIDGSTIILNSGETMTIENVGMTGSVIRSSKPLSVMGRAGSPNIYFEWLSEKLAGTSHWFYVHRKQPKLGFYAIEDTTVYVTFLNWAGDETELGPYVYTAGSYATWDYPPVDLSDKMLKVEASKPIVVAYWADENTDYVTQAEHGTQLYGCPSSVAMVMNPSLATVTMTCTDGPVETWTSRFKKIRQGAAWEGESCVLISDGEDIMVSSVGDGSGGNAATWLGAHQFSGQAIVPVDMKVLKIVSDVFTTCTIGTESYILSGAVGISHNFAQDVPAGTIVSCNDPVMVFADTDSLNDEGLLQMDEFEDPCSECPLAAESDEVCGSDWNEYASPCFAMCLGKSYYMGNCLTDPPTEAPTTSLPTFTPTMYPTTSRPTDAPVSVLGDAEMVLMMKTMMAESQRHMMLMQTQAEHDLRSRGSSGMTRIRAYATGTRNFNAEGGIANGGLLAMHDHPNFRGKIGLGEFGAVLNGVRFDTRHNDYKMKRPSPNARNVYNELVDIEYPDVPPSVLNQPTVTDQITEMQEYFRAFKEQDESIRAYKDYFKPALCFMEGAWIKQTDSLTDFFNSDRHAIDALTWEHQHNAQMFRAASGKKHVLENTPFLPTKIVDVKIDTLNNVSYPVYANFEYRIACQPVEDIPTERFLYDVDENVLQKHARGRKSTTVDDLMYTRMAKFKLNLLDQNAWDRNEQRGHDQTPPKGVRRNYLDTLMEQVPGKDGPDGVLSDDSFDVIVAEFDNPDTLLNTAKYSRYFSYQHTDAMGRQQQMRGYSDQNLFAAMTQANEVAGLKVCDELETEKCWEQKWTYAVPVEVVYLTPLENWNPFDLQLFEHKSAWNQHQNNNGRDGTETAPYVGYSDKDNFIKTPAVFFESFGGRDLADTGKAWYVEDQDGNAVQVVASGTRIVTDSIGSGIGPVRLRWPIFPIHDRSSLAYREVTAAGKKIRDEMQAENDVLNSKIDVLEGLVADLMNLISTSDSFDSLSSGVSDISVATTDAPVEEDQVGKWTESTYPVPMLITGAGFEGHTHDIWCDWNCYLSLMAGDSVEITSEDWDGHTHNFTFKLGENPTEIVFEACDSCDAMNDPHSSIDLTEEYGEVFVPFRL